MAKRDANAGKMIGEAASAPVIRCDLLPHRMNASKEAAVIDMLGKWRCTAAIIARIQWRLFQETGCFDKQADAVRSSRKSYAKRRLAILEAIIVRYGIERRLLVKKDERASRRHLPTPKGLIDPLAQAKLALGAAPVQMVLRQIVGMLEGFVSNRRNDFVVIVMRSSLDDVTRHMLLAVNVTRNWFRLNKQVAIQRDGIRIVVPHEIRLLARAIWRRVMTMHRKPSTKRIGMVLDQRAVTLLPAHRAEAFPLWIRMVLPGRGKRVEIPLQSYPFFEARKGERKLTIQVSQDRETKRLRFGVITDIGAACAERKAEYAANIKASSVPLDFGLTTMFATDRGDLLGHGFLKKLRAMDATLTGIKRHF